jgi:hypothetical protein
VKRIAPSAQDSAGYLGVGVPPATSQSPGSFNLNVWSLYGRKKLGWVNFGVEVPIVTGTVSGLNYTTFAAAGEVKFTIKQAWEIYSKLGYAPGQPNYTGGSPDSLKAFSFHPNYRLGMIMFHYNPLAFSGAQTTNNPALSAGSLRSPFYNPVENAFYGMLGGAWTISRFRIHLDFISAAAQYVAKAGESFYNQWEKRFVSNAAATQTAWLGFETDMGVTYRWDDRMDLHLDIGLFAPGGFFGFSNTGTTNALSPQFASQLGFGLKF